MSGSDGGREWGNVEDVAYGWIGTAPGDAPADRAEQAPSVVVSAAHSALGVVTRLQVRVGEVTVVMVPTDTGWERAAVAGDLDIAAHLAARMDLVERGGESPPQRWDGALPVSRYAALRTADPGDADALAGSAGCPAALVRALARPVSLSRVEVVRRDGAARGTGPTTVGADELAWVDGGGDGLWTVRPGGPDDVRISSGTPAEVTAALAGLVRAAEGC